MKGVALRRAIEAELRGNLLPFWRERSLDDAGGGFIAEMANDGTLRRDAARGLVLNARLLWTFAALHRELGEPCDRELACRAFDYIEAHFRDREAGGYHWRVDAGGRPLDRTKKTYGQAFAIYALAEYYRACGDPAALVAARLVYEAVERHARDGRHGGYLEARAEDWSATSELRLGDGETIAPKSMNTHLHVLEAYTTLLRAWPDPGLASRVRELVELFPARIAAGGHLRHYFDERWVALPGTYTYGHDIEASWLLVEAAAALGDERLAARVREWSIRMARAALAEGLDADGGLAYEGRAGTVVDGRRDWWCQAEAVVGFWHAHEATADPAFADASARVWDFISRRVVDRAGGEWFARVLPGGSVDEREPKVSEWKCPYHNVRMCLEMMRRLGAGGGR
ncbi:MAG: AGE family epimerase/isomerase [Acidobacteria bacterium]|nr:AGE family epimerase/isomerase [Acidobacteriota bacterium]